MTFKRILLSLSILSFSIFILITGCVMPSGTEETTTLDWNDQISVQPTASWTIMVYSDADCDLETALLIDIMEMKAGFVNSSELYLIVLIDRSPLYTTESTILGENFTDTRLYRITTNSAVRIGGGTIFPDICKTASYEANMGDAETLKKFITYCKTYFPANKYGLILSNHGGGTRGTGYILDEDINKAVCWDETNANDSLYTAEITDVLTPSESVDLLGFDACLMGSVEVAYQFRADNGDFCGQIMVASAPIEWGYGWSYDNIFARISNIGGDNGTTAQITGGNEAYYDPATMTALELGGIIVEEQRDSAEGASTSQQLSCYDLNDVTAVKTAVDNLAISLYTNDSTSDIENIRGSNTLSQSSDTMFYFTSSDEYEWRNYPFFDLYDLCDQIEDDGSISAGSQGLATIAKDAVATMIEYSYTGLSFTHFTLNTSGISIFFPDGDRVYNTYPHWAYQWWYNANDTASTLGATYLYGKLSWCINDSSGTACSVSSSVENWFEFLDYSFDYTNNVTGGYNGYQY